MTKTTTKLTIIAAAILLATTAHAAGTAINETGEMPDASAILDARSVTRGFLPPRMTAAQRTAISSPATGLFKYMGSNLHYLYYKTLSDLFNLHQQLFITLQHLCKSATIIKVT